MKFLIENFGCQMNDHDMERMTVALSGEGLSLAPDAIEADLIVVNTCCVRAKAEQKFYSRMGRLRSIKKKNGTILGVTGCIAQLEKDNIFRKLPFIDFALGPSRADAIVRAVEEARKGVRFSDFSGSGTEIALPVIAGNDFKAPLRASVTIMRGCNNFCSYCVVPYVRGRESSRNSTDVLEEIRTLARGGTKEVTLLGQNVNSYNKNAQDVSFPELLHKINDINGIERIRFVTSHPKDLSGSLIECFSSLNKLCEAIHLPFQSGSDRLLKLMNRGYTVGEYREKIAVLRQTCPGIAVTADCIVGFPGEGEEDFLETMKLVEEIEFDNIFSFAYSPRKFTSAAKLPNPVPVDVALARLLHLQKKQKAITVARNESLVGTRVEVLVENNSKNSKEDLSGRTRGNKIVNFRGNNNMIHNFVEVDIIKGYANSLRGENPEYKGVYHA